jgi:hypothetical protein
VHFRTHGLAIKLKVENNALNRERAMNWRPGARCASAHHREPPRPVWSHLKDDSRQNLLVLATLFFDMACLFLLVGSAPLLSLAAPFAASERNASLDYFRSVRKGVCAPPLSYSDAVAAAVDAGVAQCDLSRLPVGMDLTAFFATGVAGCAGIDAQDFASLISDEELDWNCTMNVCARPQGCEGYKAVVWFTATPRNVGCSCTYCPGGVAGSGSMAGGIFVVCGFSPSGYASNSTNRFPVPPPFCPGNCNASLTTGTLVPGTTGSVAITTGSATSGSAATTQSSTGVPTRASLASSAGSSAVPLVAVFAPAAALVALVVVVTGVTFVLARRKRNFAGSSPVSSSAEDSSRAVSEYAKSPANLEAAEGQYAKTPSVASKHYSKTPTLDEMEAESAQEHPAYAKTPTREMIEANAAMEGRLSTEAAAKKRARALLRL